LIIRNAFIFAIAGSLGAMFIALGRMFIMAATTVIMYYAMTNYYKNNELNSVWGVLIVMIFIEVFLFL